MFSPEENQDPGDEILVEHRVDLSPRESKSSQGVPGSILKSTTHRTRCSTAESILRPSRFEHWELFGRDGNLEPCQRTDRHGILSEYSWIPRVITTIEGI